MVVVFVGPAGSGKDTQALLLAKKYNFYVVSPGELLRNEDESKTEIGKQISSVIESGQLVPTQLLLQVISKNIAGIPNNTNLVFAGALREIEQVNGLEEMLLKNNRKVDRVIYLDLPLEMVQERLKGRLYTPSNGRTYHEIYNPPIKAGLDDETGEKLTRRDDDTPEVIESRIKRFVSREMEVINYYKQNGKLITIDALQSIDIIHAQIVKLLNLE